MKRSSGCWNLETSRSKFITWKLRNDDVWCQGVVGQRKRTMYETREASLSSNFRAVVIEEQVQHGGCICRRQVTIMVSCWKQFTTMIRALPVMSGLLFSLRFFLLSESSCAVHAICRYTESQDLFKVEIVTAIARASTITSGIDA